MNSTNVLMVCITIIGIAICMMIVGINATDATLNIEINMDDNTREYLIEHNFCMTMLDDGPYDAPSLMFVGDCSQLNLTMFNMTMIKK